MEEFSKSSGQSSVHISKEFQNIDKLCFKRCVSNYERAQNVKEEACLQHCLAKIINAVDFCHQINEKGGVDRAPFKNEGGFWQ